MSVLWNCQDFILIIFTHRFQCFEVVSSQDLVDVPIHDSAEQPLVVHGPFQNLKTYTSHKMVVNRKQPVNLLQHFLEFISYLGFAVCDWKLAIFLFISIKLCHFSFTECNSLIHFENHHTYVKMQVQNVNLNLQFVINYCMDLQLGNVPWEIIDLNTELNKLHGGHWHRNWYLWII